ncbi:hypothetical protein C808_05200 [Lachnospiraceae bacterium M18-1]|nr:hypothetical protein C808_05200 [Lachnospiraceae bacterium M18-1]
MDKYTVKMQLSVWKSSLIEERNVNMDFMLIRGIVSYLFPVILLFMKYWIQKI